MVGMLVFHQTRRQHDARPPPPEQAGQFDGMSRADFEMGIAIKLDEFNGGAEDGCGFLRLGDALRRGAVSCGLAP